MTGSELKQIREAIGMTRQELASATGVDYGTIWGWEKKNSDLKAWVPLALASLGEGKFKLIDGEIWVRASTQKVNGFIEPEYEQQALEI